MTSVADAMPARALDSEDASALAARLDVAIPALFRALAPTPCDDGFRRTWISRVETTRAFLRARARRWLARESGVRTQQHVRSLYDRRWTTRQWSSAASFDKLAAYGSRLYVVNKEPFVNWFYVLALAELIRLVRPGRALEIGSGGGFNLCALALLFPDCRFVGVELTAAGVAAARRLPDDPTFRAQIADAYAPLGLVPRRVSPNVHFVHGDASALPLHTETFDLVFSVLALEQMNPIRHKVVPEIARVTRGLSAHVEPFIEFNRSPFRRMHLSHKDYFRSPRELLHRYGLQTTFAWARFPTKTHFAAGLLVTRKRPR